MLTIAELIKESHGTAVEKGWWEDRDRNFGEQLMLFVTEITEVWEVTDRENLDVSLRQHPDTGKPEGLPTEIADLWIRMADTVGRYEIPLEAALKFRLNVPAQPSTELSILDLFGSSKSRTGNAPLGIYLLDTISYISRAMEEYRVNGLDDSKFFFLDPVTGRGSGIAVHFANALLDTVAACRAYDIPLVEALEAKLAYNKSRPYRHGNKLA